MNASNGEERIVHEVALVVPKRIREEEEGDSIEVLVIELKKRGMVVDRVLGLADEFLKVAAPSETLESAAAELHIRKPTHLGMELPFEMQGSDAFIQQPDGSLFSWFERFRCYQHLLYGIVNCYGHDVTLKLDGRELCWAAGESLVRRLESEGVIKQMFPLHGKSHLIYLWLQAVQTLELLKILLRKHLFVDELKRKELLKTWALNWWNLTNQPIDQIYSYFGAKIGVYFSFLGMYTQWLLFPALLGFIVQMVDFGSLQYLVLPSFFVSTTLWAALFLQFWKRKNSAMLARWQINCSVGPSQRFLGMEWSSLPFPKELTKNLGDEKFKEKEPYQRYEWFAYRKRFRNDVLVIIGIICLQLPFELAYAHTYEMITSNIIKFVLMAIYLLIIQYLTRLGSKVAVKLINREVNESVEYRANSLIYKVFGLYFMQTYIGIFYHVLLHRNFVTLRQVLLQRLIISQVFWTFMDGSLPYLKYSYRKFRARYAPLFHSCTQCQESSAMSKLLSFFYRKKKRSEGGESMGKIQIASRVEKEYPKPIYSASIGVELEDGLFDDSLKLALQFGMIMMFACAFPLAFTLAAVCNIMDIRTTALKLVVTLQRPSPRSAATIGAWLNIWQFLVVTSICTNSALLVCLYDKERKWKMEPGLAAILIMEHILLLLKFGLSRLVPEEPAWVRANRLKNVTQAQDMYSKQLLRSSESASTVKFEQEQKQQEELKQS
ncbi:unnamed protein product [Eruca vesicaria subsp. sativa]|uniref:Anoctamin transmembrane domain-containing protein n=1 Tax=Eruca vesicaria subsp. sativa TaxID=29727 RepID=A0ABC8JTX3_ERUVS|nr:unnamed protein product [Eruca vesicaria subsp. sativa]